MDCKDIDAAKAAADQLKGRINIDSMIFAAPEAKALLAPDYVMFRRINPDNEITDAGFRHATLAQMLQDLMLEINCAEYAVRFGRPIGFHCGEVLRELTAGARQMISVCDMFEWVTL